MSKENSIGVPDKCWGSHRSISKSSKGVHVVSKSSEEVLQAHLYRMNNINEILPYLVAHKDIVKDNNSRPSEKWVLMDRNKTLMAWFKQEIINYPSASKTLTWYETIV